MGYCEPVEYSRFTYYLCDWNKQYYFDYSTCFNECAYYTLNGNPVPISHSDMVLIGAFAGVLFGAVFLFALYKSLT